MSPAAAEFNSTPKTQSKQQPPFTPQNPNPNFTFSAFSMNNLSEQHQSSFPNGLAFGPSASPSGDSAVSSRSKPRLVKRRQLGFQRGKRSTPGPPCEESGLNSNQVNNNSSSTIDTSNGLSASIDGVIYGKFNNEGFVFGASKSGLESNLNAENKQTCSDGVGRFNDVGFVFGADRSNCGSRSNPEQKECSRDGGKCGAEEFGKSENVGNLLGDYRSSSDKNSLMSGFDTEKTQSGGMGQRSSDGFVFGVYVSNFDSDHNESSSGMVKSGANEFGESKNSGLLFGNTSSQLLYSNLENGQCAESGKSEDTVDFVFGAYNPCSTSKSDSEVKQSGSEEFSFHSKHGNFMQNSIFEERKYSENVEKLASDGRGRMNFDFGKVDDLGFVFHGNWSELRTNSNSVKNEFPENGGKSVPVDNKKMKSGAQFGKFDKIDFVSSVCPEASLLTIDSEKGETSRSAGNLSFEDSGKLKVDIEVEAQKAEDHDVFIFGSSSAKSCSFSESTEVGDEMSKVNPQNVRNDAGFADAYLGKLDFLINSKSNFVFGSSANTIGASGTSTVSKLSDEMKKMTVCDCKKIGCSCHMKDPSIDASACSIPVFVYGNNKKSPGYCTGKSRTTSCDQMMNESLLRHGKGSAEGFNFRTIEEDTLVFASSSDAACSFGEAAQHAMPNENNQHARSWLGDSDEQIKLGCGVFRCVWEERQPKNTNNNSSNDPSLSVPTPNPFIFQAERDIGYDGPRDQLNDHSKLNIPTNEALFPPCGLDSEALSSGRVENEGNFRFANTPLGVGESAKDFRMPNGDTSCAFMVNLSPRFNKKFESSGKSRSERDKGCKNRRGKLRRAFPESRQNHLPKEDSQQQMESPRSYSPMDFTPYQDNNGAPSTSNVTSSPQGKNEDLETVSEGAISEGDKKCRESNEEYLHSHQERVVDSSLEESQSDCSNSNTKREESECNKQNQFCFASREKDDVDRNFTFYASCTQDKLSATRHHNQKKYRMKVSHAPNTTNPSQKVDAASSSVQFPVQPHDKEGNLNSKYKGNKEDDEQGSTARTQKVCQKWRNRYFFRHKSSSPFQTSTHFLPRKLYFGFQILYS